MTAVQTGYTERMLDNSPGTMQGSDYDTKTGICETAAPGGIPFGVAVCQGVDSDAGVTKGGAIGDFLGCSLKDVTLGAEQDVYLPPNNVGYMSRGTIWVHPKDAVVAGNPVYFDTATGAFDDDASGNIGPIKGARWVTSCGGGANERAVLQLSGFNKHA